MFLSGKKIHKIITIQQLKSERERLQLELKKLQDDYYTNVNISKQLYRKKLTEIEHSLAEIDKKLRLK